MSKNLKAAGDQDGSRRPSPAICSAADNDDGACERCGRYYDLREGQEPTPFCDECAHSEVERLRGVLQTIRDYYSGAGYIGAMAYRS